MREEWVGGWVREECMCVAGVGGGEVKEEEDNHLTIQAMIVKF